MGYNTPVSDCLFCRIIQKSIPVDIVYEDDATMAFKDIQPQAPVHVLIIPKFHAATLGDMSLEERAWGVALLDTARILAKKFSVNDAGYRLVINSGLDAGQTVGHVHVHLLAGRRLQWPPG